jgi:hypothetical protein
MLLHCWARYYLFVMFTAFSSYPESERAPLLRNYLQNLQRIDDCTESNGNYYSPVDSPESMFMTEWYVLSRHYVFWSSIIIPSFDRILSKLKYFLIFLAHSWFSVLSCSFLHQYSMLSLYPAVHTLQIIPSVALSWFWCPCILYCFHFIEGLNCILCANSLK